MPARQGKDLQSARFSPPRAPRVAIPRARLVARVAEADAQLTLVCAPAGYGKTTLMQELRQDYQTRGFATVWLQIERADDDLGRFLQSLSSALQATLPEFAPDGRHGALAEFSSTQGVAADLLENFSSSRGPIAFFLDDMELIEDGQVWDFMHRLATGLDSRHRAVLASRTLKGMPIGRMRAHGLTLELDQADLRFTPAETEDYLRRQGIKTSATPALQQGTEGWPAALQLASIALKTKGERDADSLQSFRGASAVVAEYLAQEVLDSRPPPQRDFLLRSSVLEKFSAEMCDAVLERRDSNEMISAILSDNLLLSPIDVEQQWFRYHPLFADFLRARFQQGARSEIFALRRRAAEWASARGLVEDAVAYALAAQDAALAADLLAASAMEKIRAGRVADTAHAIAMIPEAEIVRRPALLRAAAFAAIFAHRFGAGARYMELIAQSGEAARGADDEIAAMRLMSLAWTDRMAELRQAVDELQPKASSFGRFTRGLVSNASAYCNIAIGRYIEAERDILEAHRACEPINALYVLSYAACFTAIIELNSGNVTAARLILEDVMKRAISDGQRFGSAAAVVATYLVEALYEANELDACESLIDDYMPIIIETGLPDHLIVLHRIAARLHFLRGRTEDGQSTLVRLKDTSARRGIPRLGAAAWLERSYAALRRNDLEGARNMLAAGVEHARSTETEGFSLHASEIEDATIAALRLHLAAGESETALPLVESALAAAEGMGRRRRALRLRFLKAQMLESLARRREAVELFDQTVSAAARGGMARLLADDAWATRSLFARSSIAEDAGAIGLLRELADARPGEPSGESSSDPYQLTSRERQILRLVWKGSSNKSIARDLFLTENTVETHLRRIYQKLGTRKRTQAAALAREAGAI